MKNLNPENKLNEHNYDHVYLKEKEYGYKLIITITRRL